MTAMTHVRYLAETIGPRGSTTPQEAAAAVYAAQTLREAGLTPTVETFVSARSAWYPFALFSTLILIAETLFWAAGGWGAWAALLLAGLAFASVLLELAFRPNLLRWLLPKGQRETFLLTAASDRKLLALAEKAAEERPELAAYSHAFRGAYTEGAIAARHGFRVLTLVSHRRDGVLPEWHRPTDVVANVEAGVVKRTEAFVEELLRRIDLK